MSPEEEWIGEAAEALEKLTRDPLADAVPGTAEILTVSGPSGLRRYQEATITLRLRVPDREPAVVTARVVFDRRAWPEVGAVLRAAVPPDSPTTFRIDWGPYGGAR